MPDLDPRHIGSRRDKVVHTRSRQKRAVFVVDGMLVQRCANTLRNLALNLPIHYMGR